MGRNCEGTSLRVQTCVTPELPPRGGLPSNRSHLTTALGLHLLRNLPLVRSLLTTNRKDILVGLGRSHLTTALPLACYCRHRCRNRIQLIRDRRRSV